MTLCKRFFAFLLLICFIQQSLALVLHEQSAACKQVKYTSGLLALTWIGEYCTESRCYQNWKDFWDGSSFVIHGYWPQSDDPSYLACLQQDMYDRFCDYDFAFTDKKLSSISADLNKYWPQIGAIKHFWKYEWDKHGTCYLKNTIESFNPAKLSADEIYLRYFRGTVNKFKGLSVQRLTKFKFNSKDEFAKQLNLKPNQFMAICGKDNELDEIRICYNMAEP
jgi:ribonuclease I